MRIRNASQSRWVFVGTQVNSKVEHGFRVKQSTSNYCSLFGFGQRHTTVDTQLVWQVIELEQRSHIAPMAKRKFLRYPGGRIMIPTQQWRNLNPVET